MAKFGAGHFSAWWRQGFKEFAQYLPAFNSGQRVIEEPGLVGNPTPQEVVEGKGKELTWGEHLTNEAERHPQRQQDDRGWER